MYVFLDKYSYLLAANCLLIGTYLTVFSVFTPQFSQFFLVAMTSGTFILVMLATQTQEAVAPSWTVWLFCYFGYGIGIGLATTSMKYQLVGILPIGLSLGLLFGTLFDLFFV